VRAQTGFLANRLYSVEGTYLGHEGSIIGLISGSNSNFRITSIEGSITLNKVNNNLYTKYYMLPPGNIIDW